ncbi:MAG: hypothetical protein ACI4US_00525, partial [Muribaculaceae bacterium]
VQHAKGMSLHSGYFDTPSLPVGVNVTFFTSVLARSCVAGVHTLLSSMLPTEPLPKAKFLLPLVNSIDVSFIFAGAVTVIVLPV